MPNIQETYENVKIVLNCAGVQVLEFGTTADIKMYLCLCGKQSASCTHSCPYCEGSSPWQEPSRVLTVGMLWEWHGQYVSAGEPHKNARMFQNVVNPPLITGQPDDTILSILFPPENHLMTGIVGKVVEEMEKAGWDNPKDGEMWMRNFLHKTSCTKASYHGTNTFEGTNNDNIWKNLIL